MDAHPTAEQDVERVLHGPLCHQLLARERLDLVGRPRHRREHAARDICEELDAMQRRDAINGQPG